MQMTRVCTVYGAPLGRHSSTLNHDCKLRCFKVNLDSGGYDDGGAYWGHGKYLYCIKDNEGNCRFIRAWSRDEAIAMYKHDYSKDDEPIRFYNVVKRRGNYAS